MDLSQINQASRSFRLVASEIDRIATESPEKPWASVPKNPENLSDGFEDVSFSQFAAAIDRASWYCHCPGLYQVVFTDNSGSYTIHSVQRSLERFRPLHIVELQTSDIISSPLPL